MSPPPHSTPTPSRHTPVTLFSSLLCHSANRTLFDRGHSGQNTKPASRPVAEAKRARAKRPDDGDTHSGLLHLRFCYPSDFSSAAASFYRCRKFYLVNRPRFSVSYMGEKVNCHSHIYYSTALLVNAKLASDCSVGFVGDIRRLTVDRLLRKTTSSLLDTVTLISANKMTCG